MDHTFWDLRDGINRLHAAHESFSSPAMPAEVPLAGLSFHTPLAHAAAFCGDAATDVSHDKDSTDAS